MSTVNPSCKDFTIILYERNVFQFTVRAKTGTLPKTSPWKPTTAGRKPTAPDTSPMNRAALNWTSRRPPNERPSSPPAP